jgi:hypothetical protein
MSRTRSKKHHYLPRYYLKGFTNSDGTFFVYDKKANNIFETNPNGSFFKNNLNTINFPDGTKSDFLEQAHTKIEGESWDSLDNIRNSDFKKPVPIKDKLNLFLFLLFLHWRLPANHKYFNDLTSQMFVEGSELDYFDIVDIHGNQASEDFLTEFKNSSIWNKSSQLVLPFARIFKNREWFDDIVNWRFYYTKNKESWYIIGDNPIVTKGEDDHDPVRCLKTFLFPISGNILLISIDGNPPDTISPEFIVQFGASIIERANRFVACQNKEFLQALIDYYDLNHKLNNQEKIIDDLFCMLEEKT